MSFLDYCCGEQSKNFYYTIFSAQLPLSLGSVAIALPMIKLNRVIVLLLLCLMSYKTPIIYSCLKSQHWRRFSAFDWSF